MLQTVVSLIDDASVVIYNVYNTGHWSLHTFQNRAELSNQGHASRPQVLTNGNLLEEDWNSTEDHGNEVDDQKGPCNEPLVFDQGILRGKYHCTVDLLFDWF